MSLKLEARNQAAAFFDDVEDQDLISIVLSLFSGIPTQKGLEIVPRRCGPSERKVETVCIQDKDNAGHASRTAQAFTKNGPAISLGIPCLKPIRLCLRMDWQEWNDSR